MKNVWIYGFNPVVEALRSGRDIKEVCLSSGRHEKLFLVAEEAKKRGIPVRTVDSGFFNDSFPKGHQGIAAKVFQKGYMDLVDVLNAPEMKNEKPFFLVLDCIEDPRNLGAILRTSEAAGVHGVLIQAYRAAGLGSEVSKTSAGAVEYVPVSQISNIKNGILEMKKRGITIVGADSGARLFPWDAELDVPLALVIGSEGRGLRKTVAEKCDILISLPMRGKINSLNVSVATAVIVYEVLRQRLSKKQNF